MQVLPSRLNDGLAWTETCMGYS